VKGVCGGSRYIWILFHLYIMSFTFGNLIDSFIITSASRLYFFFFIFFFVFNSFFFSGRTLPFAFIFLLILHSAFFFYFSATFYDFFLLFIGTLSGGGLLFVSIALVIAVLSRLGFYLDKTDISEYFDRQSMLKLNLIIVLLIVSSLIIYTLYIFTSLGLLKENKDISYDWIAYTPIRLLTTTILLVSLIVFYVLTGYTSNYILSFGIILIFMYYYLNVNPNVKFLQPFYFINIVISLIVILLSVILYVFMRYDVKMLFIPLASWFLISIYNIVISNNRIFKTINNKMTIKYITSVLVIALLILSSLSVYYSSLLNKQFQVTTDDN